MQIQFQIRLIQLISAFLQLSDHLLDVVDRREGLLDHGLVLPVEVAPGERAARVAHYDAVGIYHRDDLRSDFDKIKEFIFMK